MYRLFPDTHPKFEKRQVELLRQAPSWQKLDMVWQMNGAVRAMLVAGLRSRHPRDPQEVIQRRLADLLLGPDLANKVYRPLETQDYAP